MEVCLAFLINRSVILLRWKYIDSRDTLIFYKVKYETMSTSILIEKDVTRRTKSSFDANSLYSLVDKAYYTDGLCYKVDQWTEQAKNHISC